MLKRLGLLPLALLVFAVAAQQLSAQFSEQFVTYAGGNGQSGNMFNITAGGSDIYIAGLDLHVSGGSAETWEVYTVPSTYVGNETNSGAWTLHDSGSVTAQGEDKPTGIAFSSALMVPSGTTIGVYVTLTTSVNIIYTNITSTVALAGTDMTLTLGVGKAYPFANTFQNRAWNGTIYYTLGASPVGNPEINVVSDGCTRWPAKTQNVGVFTPGTPANRTWTIENSGSSTLPVTAISCVPSGVGNCTVTTNPTLTPGSPVAAGGSASFDVAITVTGEGPFEFTISINNGDTSGPESPYTIIVQGSGGMSGTYLVSNDAGESPDFSDLGAAFDALEASGMVGGVVIEVSEGTGPYTSSAAYCLGGNGQGTTSYVKQEVRGLSITSQLVIRNQAGERPVIQGDAVADPFGNGSGTLLFVETSFVTFQGFDVSGGHEWAVGMFDALGQVGGVRNWTVRNNIVHNTSGNGIWCYSNQGMGVDWVTIENNFVYDVAIGNSFFYNVVTTDPTLLGMGAIAFGPLGTNTVVRHNTILVNTGQPSTFPSTNHGAISVGSDAGGGVVASGPPFQELSYNIIVNTSTGIVPLDMPNRSIPTICDYNIYYNTASANVRIDNVNGVGAQDLAGWQFATSQEANSVTTNPNLANIATGNEDLHLTAGSTNAIDMAVGSTTVADDIDEDSRPSGATSDIGADEYTGGGGGGGTVTVAATTTPASEPSTNGAWTITFSPMTTATTSVSFTLTGAATFGTDYSISSSVGTASGTGITGIPAGTTTVVVTLTVIDDGSPEGNEDAILTLTSATPGYTVGTPSAGTITINDDDATPTNPAISVSSSGSPSETGPTSGTFTISASPNPAAPIQVNVSFSGTAVNGTDYTVTGVTGGQVTVPTTGSVTVTITPIDDTATEGLESVILTITTGTGYTVGTQSAATLTIADNDGTPPPPITGGGGGGGGGGGCAAAEGSSYWMLALGLLAVLGLGLRMRARRE